MPEPFETPNFQDQLRADKVTLEAMIENQTEHAKQLTTEAGDPLHLGASRLTISALQQTYIGALEHALDVLKSLLD